MNVLAVDPATNCGWALSRYNFGIWDLSLKRGQSAGIKWILFENYLRDSIENNAVDIIVYERPGGRHFNGIESHAKLVGVIEKLSVQMSIESIAFSASQIKMFATGSGRANKSDMINAAHKTLDYQGNNDNEADALWIYHLAVNHLKIKK